MVIAYGNIITLGVYASQIVSAEYHNIYTGVLKKHQHAITST